MAHPCGCVVGLALLPWPVCAGPSPDIFCLQAEWLSQSPSAAVEAKSTGAPSPSYILSGRKSKETLLGVSPVGSSLAGPLPGRGEQLPQQQGLDLPLSCSAAEAAAAAAADRRELRVLSSPARLLGNTQQLPARPGPAPGSQTIPGSGGTEPLLSLGILELQLWAGGTGTPPALGSVLPLLPLNYNSQCVFSAGPGSR